LQQSKINVEYKQLNILGNDRKNAGKYFDIIKQNKKENNSNINQDKS
jgi:hypothetical protein